MDGGGGSGIDAPGGLGDDQQARLLQDLAADDEFLQIAARQGAGLTAVATGRDAETFDDLFGGAPGLAEAHQPAPHQAAAAIARQQGVVGQGHLGHRAAPQAFLGHEGQSKATAGAGAHVTGGLTTDADHARFGQQDFPRQSRQQLGLTIAGHTGDADDFSGPHRQSGVLDVGGEGIV